MTEFLETLRVQEGELLSPHIHNRRMHYTSPKVQSFDLSSIDVPLQYRSGIVKCSVLYSDKILDIKFSRYAPRPIRKLKVVECNTIDYHLKYADRRELNALRELRGESDDVLIVKNGFVTDTSFSNVVFRQDDLLFTPDTFLLNGCKRQELINKGRIEERKISLDDIKSYQCCYLINAMLDIEDNPFEVEIVF